MASPTTRSSRRAGGLTTRSDLTLHQNNAHNRQITSNTSRRKRLRESSDHDQDSIKAKKARITIEIETKPKAQLKRRSFVIASDAKSDPVFQRSALNNATTQTAAAKGRVPTKYAEKVANGFKHELDRLEPSEAAKGDEKRALRSQEGTRFKSELSAYFPDYDVVIGNEPEETHFLNFDTPIIIIDSNPPSEKQLLHFPKLRHTNGHVSRPRVRVFPEALFGNLYQAQKVDFAFLDKHCKVSPQGDPLADSYYDAAHKRAERLERSIRNSEKGRAQHEKDQVIRLLEGLQGHDWLKVMGVSGITESKKKDYAQAREYFMKGCLTIIEKFRTWREEEKRRKLEKERAVAEAAEDEEDEDEDEGQKSDGDPPDYSDVDHAAARQLHQEAIARSAPLASTRSADKKVKVEPKIPSMDELEQEFKSFYSKRHLRESAIGRHRRSGRSSSAWGQPVPDVSQKDFELPPELRDKETLEASARRKRRARRLVQEWVDHDDLVTDDKGVGRLF